MDNNQAVKPSGTQLKKKYVLEKVLGSGGQGITYLANDFINKKKVAIKECSTERDYSYESVITRMIQLGKIDGIAQVFDIFDENNATYVVMEYVQGVNGVQFLESNKGLRDSKLIIDMMLPLINGLSVLHSKDIIHRDISTDNIMITASGKAILIDFDSVHDNTGGFSTNDTSFIKKGFSPLELYNKDGKLGIWTDIYEVCASLYHLMTEHIPIEASIRKNGGGINPLSVYNVKLSELTEKVIMNGLNLEPENRLSNITDLYNALIIEKNKQAAVTNQTNQTKQAATSPIKNEAKQAIVKPTPAKPAQVKSNSNNAAQVTPNVKTVEPKAVESNQVNKAVIQPSNEPYVATDSMKTLDSFKENNSTTEAKVYTATSAIGAGNDDKPVKSKGKKVLIALGIIAVVVAILGICIGIYQKSNEENDNTNKQEEKIEKKKEEEIEKKKEEIENAKKENYDKAVELINENYSSVDDAKLAYDNAVKIFEELGDYEDSYLQLYGIAGKYTEYDYLNDAVDVYKYLYENEFENSSDKLFYCASVNMNNNNYDSAKEIYEYLNDEKSSDGYSAKDGITECDFCSDYYLYTEYDTESNNEETLEELINVFKKYDKYYSSKLDVNAQDIVSNCESMLERAYINNGNFDKFDEAISYYKEHNDVDMIESIANVYYEASKYSEAIDVYKMLASMTGSSYEERIRECQSNAAIGSKYQNFDEENSMSYDYATDSMQPYVTKDTAEQYLASIYGEYKKKDDENVVINFGTTLLDERNYGVKKITVQKEGSKIEAEIYYQDNPEKMITIIYEASKCEQITVVDEFDENETYEEDIYYNSLIVDGVEYAIYN